ncbi:hypothetical protein GCM10027161_67760 [Microbispora hainanensis]
MQPVSFSNVPTHLTFGSTPPHSAYPSIATTLSVPSPRPTDASGVGVAPDEEGDDALGPASPAAAEVPGVATLVAGAGRPAQAAASSPTAATVMTRCVRRTHDPP